MRGYEGIPLDEVVSPEELRGMLDYNSDTGEFKWKRRDDVCYRWNGRFPGKKAFTVLSDGYLRGKIRDREFKAHRVAWAIHYGEWPDVIDHINGDRSDNRICNLRNTNLSGNAMNAAIRSDNKTGYRGVSYHARDGKYSARIKCNGRNVSLGNYDTAEAAAKAYDDAAVIYHGEYAKTNAALREYEESK